MIRKRYSVAMLSMILSLPFSHSFAAGFALIEQSGSGMGNAFAGGSAAAEDASTVYFNPAGMMLLDKQIVFAAHGVAPGADFTNSNSTTAGGQALTGGNGDDGGVTKFVPNFYAVFPVGPDDLRVGFGINVPFGLSTHYDDDWVGRYHAVESDVASLNFNPSMAFKASEKLSMGFGIDFQWVDVTLTSAVDFGTLCVAQTGSLAACQGLGGTGPQQDDGFVKLTADNFDDLGIGWNLGLLYELSDKTRFGFAYRAEIEHTLKGDADFIVPGNVQFLTSTGSFVDAGIMATATFPESLSVSMFHQYNDNLELMWDITWTGWSDFQELRIQYDNPLQPDSVTTEDWEDSMRYALGLNYRFSKTFKLRTGLAVDESPIPNERRRTPRVPGNDRTWLSLGGSFSLNEKFTIDVGYSHLFISDTEINNTFESSVPPLNHTLNGDYENVVDILSAQVRWLF